MRTILLAGIASLVLASPATAQSVDHSAHGGMRVPAPRPQASPTPKKVAPAVEPRPVTKPTAPIDPHAGHEIGARRDKPESGGDPHAGHDMSSMPKPVAAAAADPHAGHEMPQKGDEALSADPHAGHDTGAAQTARPVVGTDLPVGNAPAPAPQPGLAAARYWGGDAMSHANHHLRQHHGGSTFYQVMFNMAEYQARKGADGYRWDGELWIGGDIDRLTVKSEGEGAFGGGLEQTEVQALYSRALDPYWNLQVGVRHDMRPKPSRTYATIGLEGLAPYWFEVEGALFLSEKGDVLARAEAYYDQRITQDLVLQPRIEANFAAQDISESGVGSGLSDLEMGLRLRYERKREFAPYVGVSWERQFGDTARYSRARRDGTGGFSFVAGVRAWF